MKIPKHESVSPEDEQIIRLFAAFDPPIPASEALERQAPPWLQGDKPMNQLQRLLARPALRMALSLALLAALIGGYAIFDARTVSAGEVLEHARSGAGAGITGYRGVMAATGMGLDGAALTAVVQGNKMRAEACRPAGGCHVTIYTPQFSWTYDSELGVAERIEIPGGQAQPGVISPLGGGGSMEEMLAQISQNADLELEPADVVAGRSAYVLSITPDDAAMPRTRLWVDQTSFIILRVETLARDGSTLSSLGYTELEINPALDPSLFELAPPPGTAVTCKQSRTRVQYQNGQVVISQKMDPETGQIIDEDPEVPCPPFPTQP